MDVVRRKTPVVQKNVVHWRPTRELELQLPEIKYAWKFRNYMSIVSVKRIL